MVIFHSYVKLPEGNFPSILFPFGSGPVPCEKYHQDPIVSPSDNPMFLELRNKKKNIIWRKKYPHDMDPIFFWILNISSRSH